MLQGDVVGLDEGYGDGELLAARHHMPGPSSPRGRITAGLEMGEGKEEKLPQGALKGMEKSLQQEIQRKKAKAAMKAALMMESEKKDAADVIQERKIAQKKAAVKKLENDKLKAKLRPMTPKDKPMSLSDKDKLAKAEAEQAMYMKAALGYLKRSTKTGEDSGIKQYRIKRDEAFAQGKYATKLREKLAEQEEEKKVLAAGKQAAENKVAYQKSYDKDIIRTRKALHVSIKSGTKEDLTRYLGIRRTLEDDKASLENAEHAMDAALLVQEKVADKHLALQLRNPNDANPRVAYFVWDKIAEKAAEKSKGLQKKAAKMSKKAAEKGGDLKAAKKVRKKAQLAKLMELNATRTMATLKVKSLQKVAERIIDMDTSQMKKLKNDRAMHATLNDKKEAAIALENKASAAVMMNLKKQNRAKLDISLAKDQRNVAKVRAARMRRHRRNAIHEYNKVLSELELAHEDVQNSKDRLNEAREIRSERNSKKIEAIQAKLRHAKNELDKMKDAQARWRKSAGKRAKDAAKDAAKNAANGTKDDDVEKMKEKEEDELRHVSKNIARLKKATSTGAIAQAKKKAMSEEEETEALDHRRYEARENAEDARDRVKERTMNIARNIRKTIHRRMDRRLDRIAMRAQKRTTTLQPLLTSAKGVVRKRIIAKIAGISDRRISYTAKVRARMKRRLHRRLARLQRRSLLKQKKAARAVFAQHDASEKQRILKLTQKKATTAMQKVTKLRRKILNQEFGRLRQKRRAVITRTRKIVDSLMKKKNLAADDASKFEIQEQIDAARNKADNELKKMVKASKQKADLLVAKASIKILKAARASADRREARIRAFKRRQAKLERHRARRQIKRQFAAQKENKDITRVTTETMNKIMNEVNMMKHEVQNEAMRSVENFEVEIKEKTDKEVKRLVKAQELVPQAMKKAKTNPKAPKKFHKSSNPWEGKGHLAKQTAAVMRDASKKVNEFKEETRSAAEAKIQKRALHIKGEQMELLARRKASIKERQMKMNLLNKSVRRKVRRAKRRLNRASRKASRSGAKVDRIKVERAQQANDSSTLAARRVLAAARRAEVQRKRAAARRKVKRTVERSRKAMRRATRQLEKASVSGTKARIDLAHKRVRQAKEMLNKATEARISGVKAYERREYEKALVAGGSPTGGEKPETRIDAALINFNRLLAVAKKSGSRRDYLLAKALLQKTWRDQGRKERGHQRGAVRKLNKAARKEKRKMKRAEAKYRRAEQLVMKYRRAIIKGRQSYNKLGERAKDSKRALSIARNLADIARDNARMMRSQVNRDKKYTRKLQAKLRQISDKLLVSQSEESKANIKYKKYLESVKNNGAMSLKDKLEELEEKVLMHKEFTDNRVTEVKGFFDKQKREQPGFAAKSEEESMIAKIRTHADKSLAKMRTEMQLLKIDIESKKKKKGKIGAKGAAKLIERKKLSGIKKDEKKMEKQLVKKVTQFDAVQRKKIGQIRAGTTKSIRKAKEQLKADKAKMQKKLEKLKLKKAKVGFDANQAKALQKEIDAVTKATSKESTKVKSRIKRMKKDSELKKGIAKSAIKQEHLKMQNNVKKVKRIAGQEKKRARDAAKGEAKELTKDVQKKAKDTSKAKAKSVAKGAGKAGAKTTDALLSKMWKLRDSIDKALTFHVAKLDKKEKMGDLDKKTKELEKKFEKDVKKEKHKNAKVTAKLQEKRAEGRVQKKLRRKSGKKAASSVKNYRSLAKGFKLPSSVMPKVLDLGSDDIVRRNGER